MTLLPADSPLEATLLVPVRAAGFLAAGQTLHIRYDAFAYQKFGLQTGRILEITAGTLLPGDQANLPLQVAEPVFRVTALPLDDSVAAYGRDILLKPGMTLSADILMEKRSLLQWLLEPLHSLRGRMT
jgi:membrane fusion protein